MRRLLIPLDDSKCAHKALDWVAAQYAGTCEVQATIVHVLPGLPALFWDEGHILSGTELEGRTAWVGSWLARHRERMTPVLEAGAERLVSRGFRPEQVATRFIEDADDPAQGLLDAAREGGFQTIVLGRCGIAEGRHFLVGSLTSRLVHHGSGIAVCVVE